MAMLVTSLLLAVVTPVPVHDAHDPVLAQVQTELVFQDEHMSRRERCMANKKCRAKRHRIHQIFRYCNTWSCVKRVRKIHERRYDRMRRRYTRPYRSWLYSTRMCESGGNYATNTGNGFYGAYQFTISTWHWAGGSGRPDLNEPLEQDYRAVVLLKRDGPGHWPVCGH